MLGGGFHRAGDVSVRFHYHPATVTMRFDSAPGGLLLMYARQGRRAADQARRIIWVSHSNNHLHLISGWNALRHPDIDLVYTWTGTADSCIKNGIGGVCLHASKTDVYRSNCPGSPGDGRAVG